MTTAATFTEGIRRVCRAPAILVGVLVLTFLVTLPLGLTLRAMIQEHLGSSLAAGSAASGVNSDWWSEFTAQAQGVGTSFTPSILGFGAVLGNLSAVLDNREQTLAVAGAVACYVLFWVFLAGGILDRYARNRALRAEGFFGRCGVFFFRFLRLAVPAVIVYWLLFALVHNFLFGIVYPWATRDLTVERQAFAARAFLYSVFGALLVACNVVFDYAKIRAVVEDRRSMVGALVAAVRFITRQPAKVIGLYVLNSLAFLLVVGAYAVVAPGAGGTGWSLWAGLLMTQLYLLARLFVKLLFYASETVLFQSTLAHAEYVAAPELVWPDSPAAEAIDSPRSV